MPDTLNTYRTLTPYLVVPDADAEMRFLKAAFGATETLCHRGAEGKVMHAELTVGDSLVMIGQSSGEWKPLTAALYVWVTDVDGTYARALEAGAASNRHPKTSLTATGMPASSIATASPGGLRRRSSSTSQRRRRSRDLADCPGSRATLSRVMASRTAT